MRKCLLPALAALITWPAAAQTPLAADTALFLGGVGLARGGNSYVYQPFSTREVTIQPGDTLEYDVFIPAKSTGASSGLDLTWTDNSNAMREWHVRDKDGADTHPNTVLERAREKWYHRVIPMDRFSGKTVATWSLVLEGDEPGPQMLFADNIGIRRADGEWVPVYENGPVPQRLEPLGTEGYSRRIMLRTVERSSVRPGATDALVAAELAAFEREYKASEIEREVAYVESMLHGTTDNSDYSAHLKAARKAVGEIRANPGAPDSHLDAQIEAARKALSHTHGLMKQYTGFLIGHAHIDHQWLWEWPESILVCRDTFSQAIRFMDEFPGFAFSQSSSSLYKVVEDYYPELFKKIQAKVRKGTWDITGGRVTEGDMNMTSPESHARNFLIAQRYFREKFGKTATVGWEPDTFGHTWAMPQILKMGGIENYYFSRAGKGHPLFWWEGPDGSRVLAFDEPASGSWYNSDLNDATLREFGPWLDKTGLNEILWVYGVGNHGGGPTREHINAAREWMTKAYLPKVLFSTAGAFFDAIRKRDLSKLPVVRTELNPVFDGCYTSQSVIKRLNRDAENALTTAETVCSAASLYGHPYPRARFNDLWYQLLFNHHHDTLPGSAIHESYVKTREQLAAVIAEAKMIAGDAVRYLATRVSRQEDAPYSVLVFNPLSWKRTDTVRIAWPFPPDDRRWEAVAGDRVLPVTIVRGYRIDNPTAEPMAVFTAADVPGFGYRVFTLRPASAQGVAAVSLERTPAACVMENEYLRVTVDAATGLVTSLFDKRRGVEAIAPGGAGNALEIWWETRPGRSAWTLGRADTHDRLKDAESVRVVESGPGRAVIEVVRRFGSSSITQQIVLNAGMDRLELPTWVDWQEVGVDKELTPLLRMAVDAAGEGQTAMYEIPFAAITRPADGAECVALKSADLSTSDGGITLLNDCKSGHSAEGSTLRISLLRASADPDQMPDQRLHTIGLALWPHAGPYGAAAMRQGFAWNQPMLATRAPYAAKNELPTAMSFVEVSGDTVIGTVVKRAEDDPKGLVVRLFEADGKPANATVKAPASLATNRRVNFVEDALTAPAKGSEVSLSLRGYEIVNLMFAPAAGRKERSK